MCLCNVGMGYGPCRTQYAKYVGRPRRHEKGLGCKHGKGPYPHHGDMFYLYQRVGAAAVREHMLGALFPGTAGD